MCGICLGKVLLHSALSNILIAILDFCCLLRFNGLCFQSSQDNHTEGYCPTVDYPLAAGIQLLYVNFKNLLFEVRSGVFILGFEFVGFVFCICSSSITGVF